MREMPESNSQKAETMIDLAEGSYEFVSGVQHTFKFAIEAGGVMSGDGVNGSVQGGKVIFNAAGKDYEGHFVNSTSVEGAWTDGTPCNFTLNKC